MARSAGSGAIAPGGIKSEETVKPVATEGCTECEEPDKQGEAEHPHLGTARLQQAEPTREGFDVEDHEEHQSESGSQPCRPLVRARLRLPSCEEARGWLDPPQTNRSHAAARRAPL